MATNVAYPKLNKVGVMSPQLCTPRKEASFVLCLGRFGGVHGSRLFSA